MAKGATSRKMNTSTIACIVLCILLVPLLLFNGILIVKGLINKNTPPDVFGIMPLAVTSGSMDDGSKGCIKIGDMIFIKEVDLKDLEIDDVITFNVGRDFITHRIKDIAYNGEEVKYFITKGDANNTTDGYIYPEQIHGKYIGRVPMLGNMILFMQEPWGILLFVAVPIAAYCLVEINARRSSKKRTQTSAVQDAAIAEKDAEIERLRALVNQQAQAVEPPPIDGESSVDEPNIDGTTE